MFSYQVCFHTTDPEQTVNLGEGAHFPAGVWFHDDIDMRHAQNDVTGVYDTQTLAAAAAKKYIDWICTTEPYHKVIGRVRIFKLEEVDTF